MGGRGQVSLMYEMIISLVMLGLAWAAMFTYINAHTDGSEFLARFLAADVASTAQVVNAGNGDVLVRYDNIKIGVPLQVTSVNGRVDVGKLGGNPLATGMYGLAKRYIGATILTPSYLVMHRQSDGSFSIDDAQLQYSACAASDHSVALEQAVVNVVGTKELAAAFKVALAQSRIKVSDKNPTITITVKRGPAGENRVTLAPTDAEGKVFQCEFLKQLAALSTIPFQSEEPKAGAGFTLDITVSTAQDVTMTDYQLGQALAHAMVVHYR